MGRPGYGGTSSLSTVRVHASLLWLLGALLIPIGSAVACYHYPVFAQAFFEYAGRAIVEGKMLYRDVWDNKLPSIYYVNALWQLLFGAHYVAHWIAELAVELTTIAAFALFVRREGIRSWPVATFAFAVLASLPSLRAFDYTEAYAQLFLMLALIAVQRNGAITAGLLLGIAATFWLPAALMLLPILTYQRERESRLRFALAFAGTMAAYLAGTLWVFGVPAIAALLGDMLSYEALRSNPHGSLAAVLHHRAWLVIDRTFLIVPLVLLVGVLRSPSTRPQRFALLWLGCTLAGAAINLNFFEHYFLPSTAPLVFAIAAFADRHRYSSARRALLAFLVIALVVHTPAMLREMRSAASEASIKIRESAIVGALLAASLPPNATIAAYAFEPGIYLRANRAAAGRFANALGLDPAISAQSGSREREYLTDVRHAGAFVMFSHQPLSPALAGLIRAQFLPLCPARFSAYRVFLNRRQHTGLRCGWAAEQLPSPLAP